MKLSIVIPAYNVEQYIGRCLDSIFNQKIETSLLEVVVVNDGSKDGTEDIIKQYTAQHPNLIYIYQENQGQSVARNTGLKRATGDLIWYVDSDDATTENSIQTIFSYFEKYPNADFLTFDRIHYNLEDGSSKYIKSWGEKRIGWNLNKNNDVYEKRLDRKTANERLVADVPWFHVFKNNYLTKHQLFFVPGLLNEDDELRMRLFFFAKEIRYIPFAHYIYSANREGSITTINKGKSMKVVESCMKTVDLWQDFYNKYAKSKEDKKFVMAFLCYIYGRLLRQKAADKYSDQYKTYLEHREEWEKGYKESYWKSFSMGRLAPIPLTRTLSTLYFPQYYNYISFSYLKELLHR